MRDLFDEAAGRSPVDPNESARRSARGPQRKRFYTRVDVRAQDGGYAVLLDDKLVRTPSNKPLVVPYQSVCEAMAEEWRAQGEIIDPTAMPMTRLANSVIDAVADRVDIVADDMAKYFESDLLFYRAGEPDTLVAREAAHWDPVLEWAADQLGAHFILAEGIVHVRQPEQAVSAARSALPDDAWSVAALHLVTTITGSALLALALMHGARDADQVWAAAHVDEDFNIEAWGLDEEAAARRAARERDFRAAAGMIEAARKAQLTRG